MDEREKKLSEWESALQEDVQGWESERNRADAELQRAIKRLELVRQMRLLEEDSPKPPVAEAPPVGDARATPTSVREMTHRILSQSNRPLHISEIHKQFLSNGYPIPGSGTPFNILAHLVNNKAFVRVARGTYALVGSVPQEQVLQTAERKAKHRRRDTKSVSRHRVEE